jgi:hypothetical protein
LENWRSQIQPRGIHDRPHFHLAYGSEVLPIFSIFRFALCERKNEIQKEDKVPLRTITSGRRVSPVLERYYQAPAIGAGPDATRTDLAGVRANNASGKLSILGCTERR